MKVKIRFIIIGFIILIIPIGWIFIRAIAIEIQKEAIALYQFGGSPNDLDKAIEKINLAIKLAPKNYLFYATKADILESQKKFRDAINEFQKINDFKDNYAEGYVAIGMNYERLGYADSSKIFYAFALNSYKLRIEKCAKDKERLFSERVNKAFVFALLEDSVSSSLEFNQLKKDYPEYLEMIKQIEIFDKEEDFININN